MNRTQLFINQLKERIIVFDGAMGTSIQKFQLNADDFQGKEGCNDFLNLTKPTVIEKIHADYLAAGAQTIETNTFGATRIVLSEYDLQEKTYLINKKGAELARKVADSFSSAAKPCFVSGSVGPGTKLPSLGQISFKEMYTNYQEQIEGLVDGGADLIQIETTQDMLQIKSAIIAANDVFIRKNKKLPLIVQATIQENGRMLLGSDMKTVIHTFADMADVIGVNCSTGPTDMRAHVRTLSLLSPRYISVLPNAGLPVVKDGILSYDLTPRQFAEEMLNMVKEHGINIAGGCCGTTPEHIKLLAEKLSGLSPKKRIPEYEPSLTSLFNFQPLKIEPRPLIIGEKANTNGSKKFRELLYAGNWEEMTETAVSQQDEGAHVLDICLATVDRNEASDMEKFVLLLNQTAQAPLMIDTTSLEVMETALSSFAGKVIINSTNFENGEDKTRLYLQLAKKYGAALICLAIDEKGMAKEAEEKIAIFKRFLQIADSLDFPHELIFFDCLTFSLGTGEEESRNSAINSLKAIRELKTTYPEINTLMGVSNVSYGLKPKTRKILNSVFLNECLKYGLDAAIVDAGKIQPFNLIPENERKLCLNLIYDLKKDSEDPLMELVNYFSTLKNEESSDQDALSPLEKIEKNIINGSLKDIDITLNKLLEINKPEKIISEILLPAMKEVGNLFSAGELQLPFVLKSAEVMKKSVNYLEQFMEKTDQVAKARVLLATVQGDVHDIGKNLVNIILSNNGYEVIDLGIKQTPQQILQGIELYKPDAIGLSALLIKSTMNMKETLQFLNDNRISQPVMCGGAALNEKFVISELQSVYSGNVYYGKDAFAALRIMEQISKKQNKLKISVNTPDITETSSYKLKPVIPLDNPIPVPLFKGNSQLMEVSVNNLLPWINRKSLFYQQWQFRADDLRRNEEKRRFVENKLQEVSEIAFELIRPVFLYGYYDCFSKDDRLILFPGGKNRDCCASCCPSEEITFRFNRSDAEPYLCVADYFRPVGSFRKDLVALQLVSLGKEAVNYAHKLKDSDDFQDYFFWHGFCSVLTEALAAYVHQLIRKEMKINQGESKDIEEVLKGNYQGARYSFGYSCCSDLSQQRDLLKLLNAEEAGISMNEADQLIPEFSTAAIVVHHPLARYW